jgi:hypothetical protein
VIYFLLFFLRSRRYDGGEVEFNLPWRVRLKWWLSAKLSRLAYHPPPSVVGRVKYSDPFPEPYDPLAYYRAMLDIHVSNPRNSCRITGIELS